MRGAPYLIGSTNGPVEDPFTIDAMIELEQRLHRAIELMAERERYEVDGANHGLH